MSFRKLKVTTTRQHAAQRLDEFLAAWLTEKLQRSVSKSKVRKLIMAGVVRLDNRPVRIASLGLTSGQIIETTIDVGRLFADATSRDKPFELTPKRILFEDEDLIAVDKPSGLPSQPTVDESRDSLFGAVRRYLTGRDRSEYLGVHQRLDRDTSGVVLFTKSKRVNAPIAEVFAGHLAGKTYQAITIPGEALREWTVMNYLGKVSSKSKLSKFGAVRSGGDFAETAFRMMERYPGGLWIEAIPKTGRTHQIRVHLAEHGLPILGDELYGTGDARAPRLMLHATQLVFPHPITRREIVVKSELPTDFLNCLDRIRRRI